MGLVFLVCLTGTQPVAAQSQALPVEEFWTRLGVLQQTLYTEPSPADLATLADQFERESSYFLPNGRVVAIRPRRLIFLLRQSEPNLERIDAQIEALFTARNSWELGNYSEAELGQLQEILADPAFDYTPPAPSPIQEFLRDLWLRANEFFNSLIPNNIRGSETLSTIISYVGMIGFILVLGSAFLSLYRSFYSEASGIELVDDEVANLTADGALNRAQAYSTGGDYRTAVRYLYLSALLLLEEQGLLRYDRSLTNREYLRSVAHKPELAIILRNVIEVFDRVWYGFQPLAATEYNEYAQQVEVLKQQRPKR